LEGRVPIVAINAEKAHADGIAANWGTLSHQFATNQHRRANRPWSCPGEKIWIRVTDAIALHDVQQRGRPHALAAAILSGIHM
jgi:hypothetical protein